MTPEKLQARLAAEEETLRKSAWAYHVNRGVMELLAPLLERAMGPDFTGYVRALEDRARERSWTAYQTGNRLGKAVVKKNLPSSLCEELSIEDLVGSVPYAERLRALGEHMRAIVEKYFELYDLAALEIQGVQEIRAGLWGLRDGGADEAWVEAMSCYLPDEWETPQWM